MSGHTPGPWAWGADDAPRTGTHFRVLGNGNTSVAIHQAHWPVTDEDARLLAAAPELLEACKVALRIWNLAYGEAQAEWQDLDRKAEQLGKKSDALKEQIRAAIAKAEGP